MSEPGKVSLRERKKQQVRRRFQRIALELFDERGFEHVTVDDIAERAEISRSTFFRYFPTKEDVLIGRADEHLEELRDAFVARAPDEPVLRSLRHSLEALAASYEAERSDFVAMRRIAQDHPSILARGLEHQAVWEETFAELLADRLQDTTGPGLHSRVVAGAVMAAIRVAIDEWLAEDGSRDLQALIGEAFEVLGDGLFRALREPG
ncbi:TetR family transcriptional regulator [Acidimicrobiia bacterium EGI L10123]|uniref:TetR family transcriptional regulator n=1 Tax=Salinilacustrithrix flava TaxID=2957203 RepID=UPI003D7C1AFA|nr:TetR family transcriptional regulator [Acidimicrobiia bacterium EGI L10123]